MDEKLYIEGILFDLYPRSVSQTFQVNDMADMEDRRANYSNTINAPRTPRNVEALDMLGIPGNDSSAPFKKLNAKYTVNNVEIVSNGYARVRASGDNIKIVVYSGNISLNERIDGKYISDLDYSELNHFLNISSYINGLQRTEGYVYALGNFGYGQPTAFGSIQVERQVPSIFFKYIWDKIFEESGATYEGDFVNDEGFLSEVLPMGKGYEVIEQSTTTIDKGSVDTSEVSLINLTPDIMLLNYDLTLSAHGALNEISLYDSYTIRVGFSGTMRMDVVPSGIVLKGFPRMKILRNGGTIYSGISTDIKNGVTKSVSLTVAEGDLITVKLVVSSEHFPEENIDRRWAIDIMDIGAEIFFKKISGGLFIDFKAIVPELTQKEFLKDIMQRYGLIYDSNDNHYRFVTIEALLSDRSGAEDWSDKIKSLGEEEYEIGSYASENILRYVYPDTESGETRTEFPYDGSVVSDNEHSEDSADLFTSVFTVSDSSKNYQAIPLYDIPLWEASYDDGVLEEVVNLETAPRIFKLLKIQDTISLRYFDNVPTEHSALFTYLSLVNLEMDFFASNFLKGFQRMISKPRLRTSTFLLSVLDIYKLDFFKLKHIKQLGQYFYLNKVSNFVPGRLTQCELIQVEGISLGVEGGNQAPSQLGTKNVSISYEGTLTLNINHFIDTTPEYYDTEFDQPENIKIISFGTNDIKMYNNGVEITEDVIVSADDINLTIHDLGNVLPEHSAEFEFKIQSYNNSDFSDATGTIAVNVPLYEIPNRAPVADAGVGVLVQQDEDNQTFMEVTLNGCNSYDLDEDILTYQWAFIEPQSGTVIVSPNSCSTVVRFTQLTPNMTTNKIVELTLTVTDEHGLTDSDIARITIAPRP